MGPCNSGMHHQRAVVAGWGLHRLDRLQRTSFPTSADAVGRREGLGAAAGGEGLVASTQSPSVVMPTNRRS